MKKLILVTLLSLFGTLTFGQVKNLEFIGLWEPTGTNKITSLFYQNEDNTLQIQLKDKRDGELLHIISIKSIDDNVIVEAECESNNWYSSSVYSFESGTGMLKCVVTNALGSFESYFEKQKNN